MRAMCGIALTLIAHAAMASAQSNGVERTFRALTDRPALPNTDGLSPQQVKDFLGPPAVTQVLRDNRIALSYATPDGPRTVYVGAQAVTTRPSPNRARRSATAASEQRASSPASDVAPAACDGILALGGVRTVTIRAPRSPVFSTPQIRQDPLRLFSPGTELPVVDRGGAWYVVRWQGDLGPQTGYLHCSDATVNGLTH